MALLSDADRKDLERNPIVLKVTNSNVTYTPQFKLKAVKQLSKGISPNTILLEAGIKLTLFNEDYPRKSLGRWKKNFDLYGESAFKNERRGSGATGRPKKKFNSPEAELKYLRAENDFLKKLQALAEKYQK